MNFMKPNKTRAIVGAVAFCCMVAGAWMLWGGAAALFIGGLFGAIDISSDELVERITKTTRFEQT